MPNQTPNVRQVFLATGHQLGGSQIMNLQTQPSPGARVLIANRYQSILPSLREHRSFHPHSMRVIAKSLMEWRTLTNAAFHQLGIRWIAQRKEIDFDRHPKFNRSFGELAENCLTANNYKISGPGNPGRRPNNVLKLVPFHGWKSFAS